MMNKKKILSLVLAAIMTVAMAVPAFAATGYTGKLGGTTEFTMTKYLFMDKDAQALPTVTFTFTVAPGEADPEKGIEAGPETGLIKSITAEFSKDDVPVNYGDPTAQGVPGLTDSQKFVKKDVTIDFKDVEFDEPGIYRYKITETASEEEYIDDDTAAVKTLDVYINNNNGSLEVGGFVLDNKGDSVKSKGYVNTYLTYSLTFENDVTGNQASNNQYFKYTVNLTGTVDGDYKVNLTGAETNNVDGDKTNPATITVKSGSGTADFYMKNGQTIIIEELPKGTSYTVTQETVEGYNNTEPTKTGTISNDVVLTFTNTKEGTVPTGVMLVVAPFAAIMAIGGVGAYAIMRKKNKDEDED